jgi:hypothetical protein
MIAREAQKGLIPSRGPADEGIRRKKRMKKFTIRSAQTNPSILELVDEIENGFYVRIYHNRDGWEDIQEEFMSYELLDTCLRTGYLAELTA